MQFCTFLHRLLCCGWGPQWLSRPSIDAWCFCAKKDWGLGSKPLMFNPRWIHLGIFWSFLLWANRFDCLMGSSFQLQVSLLWVWNQQLTSNHTLFATPSFYKVSRVLAGKLMRLSILSTAYPCFLLESLIFLSPSLFFPCKYSLDLKKNAKLCFTQTDFSITRQVRFFWYLFVNVSCVCFATDIAFKIYWSNII